MSNQNDRQNSIENPLWEAWNSLRSESVHTAWAEEAMDALVDAALLAYQELNEIRARDGIPWTHMGCPSDVTPEHFSSVVEKLDKAVLDATGHGAHCHPLLHKGSHSDEA